MKLLSSLICIGLLACSAPVVEVKEPSSTIKATAPQIKPEQQKTACELMKEVLVKLSSPCYFEIQEGCVKNNELGRQSGECPVCDALDKKQREYNDQCVIPVTKENS